METHVIETGDWTADAELYGELWRVRLAHAGGLTLRTVAPADIRSFPAVEPVFQECIVHDGQLMLIGQERHFHHSGLVHIDEAGVHCEWAVRWSQPTRVARIDHGWEVLAGKAVSRWGTPYHRPSSRLLHGADRRFLAEATFAPPAGQTAEVIDDINNPQRLTFQAMPDAHQPTSHESDRAEAESPRVCGSFHEPLLPAGTWTYGLDLTPLDES